MGYVVLHLDKSPDNEVPMTAHIARTKMPPNAIPSLTYLNEELVEFPEDVADRTEAINHRLEHAGLTRKIGMNQVRVIRVMLTGTQEDMQRIVQE
ncbi:MAG: plasmid recombination protein, partial [Alistipes sp.]|nr:plasmid recombination protein [Alistipes sp.]